MARMYAWCLVFRRSAAVRLGLCFALGLSATLTGGAGGPIETYTGNSKAASTQAAGSERFEFYLDIFGTRPLRDLFGGQDPVKQTDLSGTPYRREAISVEGWKLGRYRRQGPHLIAIENPNLTQHMRALERHVAELVPIDYEGFAIIDYEPWWALWERTPNEPSSAAVDALDDDYKDDWRDYIREHRTRLLDGLTGAQQELVYERTYESFMRTFLLSTYYKCKQLRPRTQWGFYNYPQVMVHSDITPHGVQGYGDLTHEASQLNDQTQWLYDAVDFVVPRIYPPRKIIEQWPPDNRRPGEISASIHEMWLSSIVRESVRLANGTPVYPLHSALYYAPRYFGGTPVTQFQHEEVFRVLAESGADGVIIWHAVTNPEELDRWNAMWESEIKPAGINAEREINGP